MQELLMQPRFLAEGETAPANSLGVDGHPAGCTQSYSHWQGHTAPKEIAADSATAILLRASLAADRWLRGFDYCVNDHVDTDGLLSMALACQPAYGRKHAPLLVGAAAYGDFNSWPGEEGAQLALRLHQLIRDEEAQGGEWQQRCIDRAVHDLDMLVGESRMADPERDAQIEMILQIRHSLMGEPDSHCYQIERGQGFSTILCPLVHGHHPCGPTTVHQADDCPPWVLDGFVNEAHHRLIGLEQASGIIWQLEAPPHSWAHTVRLPQVPWPTCTSLAKKLQERESADCRWIAGEEARQRGFTTLLASVQASDPTQGAVSSIAVIDMQDLIQNLV